MTYTYPELALALRCSTRHLRRLVQRHCLTIRYGRVGSHPRRRAIIPEATARQLRRVIESTYVSSEKNTA